MSAMQLLGVAGLAIAAVAGLSACQSTQSKSAELEAKSDTLLLSDKGLKVTRESADVKVVSSDIVTSPEGSAVVVDVHNDSPRNLTDVPISIDVLDAKGKSVYRNDIPGIEQALTAIPYVPAGGDAEWVNDQVLATGKPSSVKVKIGASSTTFDGRLPDIEMTQPELKGDPVSGVEATGDVVNKTGAEQGRMLFYVVARKGGEVVAAGRGAIEHFKGDAKPVRYTVFFIGDPTGAELELSEFPPLPGD
jgi:hypothetical protein